MSFIFNGHTGIKTKDKSRKAYIFDPLHLPFGFQLPLISKDLELNLAHMGGSPAYLASRGDCQSSAGDWERFLLSQQPDIFLIRPICMDAMMALTIWWTTHPRSQCRKFYPCLSQRLQT